MDARRYGWADDDERLTAACLTAVTGIEVEEVVRRFGGDLTSERHATFDEAFNPYPDAQYVLFDDRGETVLLAENNGWQGSRPEVAEAVSPGGALGSLYWSVNAGMAFLYAEDGVVVAWFDPLLIEQPWSGARPESVRETARDLRFGVERARSDALVLLERLTGVSFEQSWFDRPHRCVAVPGTDEYEPLTLEAYASLTRRALREWWRSFRGKGS